MRSICVASAVAFFTVSHLQAQISDDFDDGAIDSGIWSMHFPTYGTGSLSEGGGTLSFVNGPIVTANQTFSSATIEGRFKIHGWNYDRFSVLFRSDGSIDDHWQSPWGGIGVRFSLSSNPDYGPTQSIQIRDFKYDYDESLAVLASSDFVLTANTYYDFKIVDDGYTISLFMNGSVDPVLSVGTLLDYGDTIQFSNRSQMHTWPPPYNMDLDYVNIIPEPTTFTLIGLGSLAVVMVRRRR